MRPRGMELMREKLILFNLMGFKDTFIVISLTRKNSFAHSNEKLDYLITRIIEIIIFIFKLLIISFLARTFV